MSIEADLVRLRLTNEGAYSLLRLGLDLEQGKVAWWGSAHYPPAVTDLPYNHDLRAWFCDEDSEDDDDATKKHDILGLYFAAWSYDDVCGS